MEVLGDFYKMNKNDKIWWTDRYVTDTDGKIVDYMIGEYLFSFDKKKVYNLFLDYHKLSKSEKAIFDKENPTLAELVKGL